MKIIAITPDKKKDYLVSGIIEGLYKNRVKVYASDYGNNVRNVYNDDDLITLSKDIDYILVFWGKVRGNRPPKYYLLKKFNRPEITAYIDGSEWTYTGYRGKKQKSLKGKEWINKKMYKYCKWYFKRECYPEDAKLGIIPLLFCALDENFGHFKKEKYIDVFCSFGQNKTGLRRKIENYCLKLQYKGYNIVIGHNFEYEKYKELIASSYISIDAWGGGNCCARLWEIIANKSCCFSQKYKILFPNKFIDGYSFVEYSNMNEFKKKLNYYLKNKEECLNIAKNGFKHLIKYHTSKERVKYMINILENS
ncbi:MAG: glycosyltransferase [Promethearchaeota archaeon]